MIVENRKLDYILRPIHNEVTAAQRKFPPYSSAHEGSSVIREEFEELWHEIKNNKTPGATLRQLQEAIQVASTAARYLHDLFSETLLNEELERRHDNPVKVFGDSTR